MPPLAWSKGGHVHVEVAWCGVHFVAGYEPRGKVELTSWRILGLIYLSVWFYLERTMAITENNDTLWAHFMSLLLHLTMFQVLIWLRGALRISRNEAATHASQMHGRMGNRNRYPERNILFRLAACFDFISSSGHYFIRTAFIISYSSNNAQRLVSWSIATFTFGSTTRSLASF